MIDDRPAAGEISRRWLVAGLVVAIAVLVGAAAWVAVRAVAAAHQLDAITPAAGGLSSDIANRDLDALASVSHDVGRRAQTAASLTGDPLWQALEVLPSLGPNLRAARVASAQLDSLSNHVIDPLLAAARALHTTRDGGIDLVALGKASGGLSAAADRVAVAQRELDAVPVDDVIPRLASGVVDLRHAVRSVAPVADSLAGFSRLGPAMLGADGTRTILMIVQNNAELRTGGGISGEFVQLTADRGKITLGDITSTDGFDIAAAPLAPVPASTTNLYGDVVGRYAQDTTMTSDFGLTGRLASAWWTRAGHVAPDAVLSIDPVVMQSLLAATGPVTLAGETPLTADNAAQRLLVEPYLTLADDAAQNAFFAMATRQIFSHVTGGDVDPVSLMQSLQTAVAAGRVSLWSAHPDEQRTLHQTALGGPAARQALAGRDAYSIYLNDATAAKMDSFLHLSFASGTVRCDDDAGRRDVVITATMHSSAPADAATSLPGRMTGWGISGTPAGDISTNIAVAAPAGSYVGGVTVDGAPALSVSDTDNGFPTSLVHVQLSPGQTKTVSFRFHTTQKSSSRPVLLTTPMIDTPSFESLAASCR